MTQTKESQKLHKVFYLPWKHNCILSKELENYVPDGCSLHLTEEDAKKFVESYYSMFSSELHSSYPKPAGKPINVWVNSEIYELLSRTDFHNNTGRRYLDYEEEELYNREKLFYGIERMVLVF